MGYEAAVKDGFYRAIGLSKAASSNMRLSILQAHSGLLLDCHTSAVLAASKRRLLALNDELSAVISTKVSS